MWTSESLSKLARRFRERQEARRLEAARRNRVGGRAEKMEARVMLSIAQAVEAGLPDVRGAVVPHAPAADAKPAAGREVVFIDAGVAGSAHLPAGADVVTLDAGADALRQITAGLAGRQAVTSVDIVSHGAPGSVRLGGRDVGREDLLAHADELRQWAAGLARGATIDLYGCDVAEGTQGRKFVDTLAKLTGATVAASTDPTGPASLGGDSVLEYVAPGRGEPRGVGASTPALSAETFGQVLATYTIAPSAGVTTHVVAGGATVVDAGVTVTAASATSTTGIVAITAGTFRTGEDVLAVTSAGVTGVFSAATGMLTITSATGLNAAQWQGVFRAVTFATATTAPNLTPRGVTFTIGSDTSAAKTVTPDLPVDEATQTRIVESFGVVEQIGAAIQALAGTPGKDDQTEVPFTGGLKVTDLLYPIKPDLDANGQPQPDYARSVQPQGIGAYLALKTAAQTYFDSVGLVTDLTPFVTAMDVRLAALVPGTSAIHDLTVNFTKPAATDARSLAITVTIANTMGNDIALVLPDLERDLGLHLPTPPTVTAGGGADVQFTITIDLQGHTYGSTLAQNKATVAFARANSLAGFSLSNLTTTAEFGLIRGQIVGGSGVVGATIPVTFSAGGPSRTLDTWLADAAPVSGFSSTITGSASLTLPVTASLNGVAATTANSKVVVTDSNIFDSTPPQYVTTDFSKLLYFGTMKVEDVIQEVLKVGNLYDSLTHSDAGMFGVQTPLLKNTTLGDLLDFSSLFKSAIGSKIDVYEPVLNTAGRDVLTDWRLPISEDSEPKPSMYSDLRGSFDFGVVVNDAGPVHTISVAADGTRNTLDDLVSDVNAALSAAGVGLTASNVGGKMSLKASGLSVQTFAVVPVAPPAARLSPTAPPADLSTLGAGATAYYTVTGTTTGTVTGTNYYTLGTPLGAAAVHAGILKSGETGVVKVTRVGNLGSVWASTRHGVSSAAGSGESYLIESGVSDLRRLGIVAYDSSLRVLEQYSGGRVRATLPLQANLSGFGQVVVDSGTNHYTVNVADNNRTDLLDTLADVKAGLVSAGIAATDLTAHLVDAQGTELAGAPRPGPTTTSSCTPPPAAPGRRSPSRRRPTRRRSACCRWASCRATSPPSPGPRPCGRSRTSRTPRSSPASPSRPSTTRPPTPSRSNSPRCSSASPSVAAAFDFSPKPLGRITASNANLTFSPSVASHLAFGLEFNVKPSNPITIASGTLPATGRLTGDAHFSLDMVLQDKYAVTVPAAWTSGNADVQDLVADVNRALKQAVPSAGGTVDLTSDRLVARRQVGGTQFELVTAAPTNGGNALSLSHTNGVLSSDLSFAFTHNGKAYVLKIAADGHRARTTR